MSRVERAERERLSGRRRVNVARVITPLPPSPLSPTVSLFLLFSPSRSLSPSRDAFGHIVSVLLSFSLFLSHSPFVSSFSPSCPTLFSSSSYSRTILLVSLTVSSLVHLTSPLPPGGLLSSTRPLEGAKSLRALSSRPSFSPFPSSVHLHARACCKSIKKIHSPSECYGKVFNPAKKLPGSGEARARGFALRSNRKYRLHLFSLSFFL